MDILKRILDLDLDIINTKEEDEVSRLIVSMEVFHITATSEAFLVILLGSMQ